MPDSNQTSTASPWAQGHSIDVLRQVAAGIVATVQDFTVEQVDAGGVASEWIVANGVSNDAPVALYFHGGAYLCGTPEQYRNVTVALSGSLGRRVLVVDYRLAPENPHPAAFEDAISAYRWVLNHAVGNPDDLLVAGDSAGASIAVGLALDVIALGLPAPVCVVANSPFSDLALQSPSLDKPELNDDEPNKTTIEWLARTYLAAAQKPAGERLSAKDPRHSPIYRDLRGLPPLLVQIGGLDNLQDDGARLAAQAERCGVDVTLTRYSSSAHIWIVLRTPEEDPDVAAALTEIQQFVGAHPGHRAKSGWLGRL